LAGEEGVLAGEEAAEEEEEAAAAAATGGEEAAAAVSSLSLSLTAGGETLLNDASRSAESLERCSR